MNISELKTLINEIIDPSNEMTIGETQSLKHISYDEEKDTVVLKVAMGRLGGEKEKKFRRDIARIVKVDCGFSGLGVSFGLDGMGSSTVLGAGAGVLPT